MVLLNIHSSSSSSSPLREMAYYNKGMHSSSGGSHRGRPYVLILLIIFGAALLGVMVLHKLRERRIYTLLVKEKDHQILALQLLLQVTNSSQFLSSINPFHLLSLSLSLLASRPYFCVSFSCHDTQGATCNKEYKSFLKNTDSLFINALVNIEIACESCNFVSFNSFNAFLKNAYKIQEVVVGVEGMVKKWFLIWQFSIPFDYHLIKTSPYITSEINVYRYYQLIVERLCLG